MKISEKRCVEKAQKGANETFKSQIGDSAELNFSCLNIRPKNLNSFRMQAKIKYKGLKCGVIVSNKGFVISTTQERKNLVLLDGKQVPKELEKQVLKAFGYIFK